MKEEAPSDMQNPFVDANIGQFDVGDAVGLNGELGRDYFKQHAITVRSEGDENDVKAESFKIEDRKYNFNIGTNKQFNKSVFDYWDQFNTTELRKTLTKSGLPLHPKTLQENRAQYDKVQGLIGKLNSQAEVGS